MANSEWRSRRLTLDLSIRYSPLAIRLPSMLILAIDTALDACAAGVLDTDAGQADRAGIAADEARPRRSADAADRARDEGGRASPFAALDRIAVTTGPGSFTGLRVGLSAARGIALAADKPVVGVTTLSAYAAPVVSESGEHPVISAIDARHDHVYFQAVSGDGSCADPAARRADRRGARRMRGSARRIWSATPRRFSPSAGRRMRRRRSRSTRKPAPDIAWVAWLGAAVSPNTAPARPFYLRAPDAKPAKDAPQKPRRRPPHDGMALRTVERRHGGGRTREACAMRRGSRSFTAHRFTAAGVKANSRAC